MPSICGRYFGRVRQVAVHLHDELRAGLDRAGHAVHVGPPQALFAGPVHDAHPGLAVPLGEAVGDVAGAIGRVVVRDQDPQAGQRQAEKPATITGRLAASL